jgi:hypothetical protein
MLRRCGKRTNSTHLRVIVVGPHALLARRKATNDYLLYFKLLVATCFAYVARGPTALIQRLPWKIVVGPHALQAKRKATNDFTVC